MKLFLISLFLLLAIPFASSAYAIDKEEAYTQCNNYLSSHNATYGKTCRDYGSYQVEAVYCQQAACTSYGTFIRYAYTLPCNDTSKIFSDTSKTCQIPKTCSDGSVIPSDEQCPISCVTGATKTLWVTDSLMPANTAPTYRIHNHRVVTENPTASLGHCVYSLPRSGYHNCIKSSDFTACSVVGVATGGVDPGSDTAVDPDSYSPSSETDCNAGTTYTDVDGVKRCKVDKSIDDCLRTTFGDLICNASPKKNCGLFNHAEVCVSSDGTITPTVDGHSTTTINVNGQTANCFKSSTGEHVCINTPTVPKSACTPPFVCFQPDPTSTNPTPNVTAVDKNVNQVTTSTTTPNSNGGTTTIEVTTQNIYDSEPITKTTIKDANGNVVSTTYSGGQGQLPTDGNGHVIPGTGNGQSQNNGDNCTGGDCLVSLKPDSTVRSLTTGTDGTFNQSIVDSEYLSKQGELQSKIDSIKVEANTIFSPISSSSGALPVFHLGTLAGGTLDLDLNDYQSYFSDIGKILVFMATALAFFILFG